MELNEKIEALVEIFDCDAGELKPETQLNTLEWDSMAMLSLIAIIKAKFNKKISGEDLRNFKTIKDILDRME